MEMPTDTQLVAARLSQCGSLSARDVSPVRNARSAERKRLFDCPQKHVIRPHVVQEHPSLKPSVSENRDNTSDTSSATCADVSHSKPRHGPDTHVESSQSAARQRRSATDFEVR